MMQAYDPVCLDAFERLLARPDPRDLPRRAHVFSCDGDPTLILRTQRPAGLTTTSQERARLNADARDQSPLDLGAIDVYRWEKRLAHTSSVDTGRKWSGSRRFCSSR
jgi:hypothetical protein